MSRNKESIERFFNDNVHIETRTLYIGDIYEGIGPDTAADAIKALHLLNSYGTDKPITVLINSFGGCWYNGMAIFDAIKSCISHVDAYVIGSAMSMGSVMLQSADVRYAYPNSTIMIHDGSESLHSDARSFISWGKYAERTLDAMYKIYAERSGKTAAFWKKRCAHDCILSAKEAKQLGLIDTIVGEN